jgi:SlyX protein
MEHDMSDSLSKNASRRLDALEMRIAHQDRMIAELNEVITAQWRKIDALAREVVQLREEYQNAMAQRDAPEPPPPHY